MPFTTTEKNAMLDGVSASVLLALFTGDPTGAGVEVTGAGYARKAGTMAAASGGEKRLAADVSFGFASSGSWTTASWIAVYNAAGTVLRGYAQLSSPITVDTMNGYILLAGSSDLRLRLLDP